MSFLDRILEWVDSIVHHDDYATAVVRKGDTLWNMVKDVSGAHDAADIQRNVDEVKALNPGMDPDMIHPGQEIKFPLHWVA